MTNATDEATIQDFEDDHPTMREYYPDQETTVEDLTFWPSWSTATTRPIPN